MPQVTEDEWQHIYENFETTSLLYAVDALDHARSYLGNRPNFAPPKIRDELMKLHELAVNVINDQEKEDTQELFELAEDLNCKISEVIESLETIQKTLYQLEDLYPNSLLTE